MGRISFADGDDNNCRGYFLVSSWVVLNLALNFLNKWALSPLDVTLSWGNSLMAAFKVCTVRSLC